MKPPMYKDGRMSCIRYREKIRVSCFPFRQTFSSRIPFSTERKEKKTITIKNVHIFLVSGSDGVVSGRSSGRGWAVSEAVAASMAGWL